MEKLEKKEKKEKKDKKEDETFVDFVVKKIQANRAAKQKWDILTAKLDKDDLEEIAEQLFRYCFGSKEQLQKGLKLARRFRDQFDSVVEELRRTAKTVERMIRELREIGGTTIYDSRFQELPSTLRNFADELDRLGRAYESSIARGTRIETDGRISGGRAESLSIAANLVSEVTGEPYALLAPLVVAIEGRPEFSMAHVADSLRNEVNRYRKQAWGI
jgi:hypothetical protein